MSLLYRQFCSQNPPEIDMARQYLPFNRKKTDLKWAIARILGISLVGPLSCYAAPGVNELPGGGQIIQGSGSVHQQGNTLTVVQSTNRIVGQWNTFNIGQNAVVNFQQPGADSVALNRIADQNPSQIEGHLNANGQVFLVNPSGVIFGKDAQVDVGGIVVSTQQISDADFAKGKTVFSANPGNNQGMVDNQGQITAHGGVVALIAPNVKNSGTIADSGGTVVLAAGEQVTLDFQGDGLVNVVVDKAALNAQAENKGLIQADAGTVVMTARSANALLDTVVNNDGVIQAQSLNNRGGRIVLDGGESGVTRVAGALDASSLDGKGGLIEVTGDKILVDKNADLAADGKTGGGTVLVGGSYQNNDASVRQATAVYMDATARITANAGDNGDGGVAVVRSDVANSASAARVYGDLEAKGGANGGNGGQVETSGYYVDVAGIKVNAAAPKGKAGNWLLDPYDLTVSATPTTATGSPNFASGLGATNVLNTDINTLLNSGTSVTLQTTGFIGDGNGAGDITINAGINKTAGADANLTMIAHNGIIVSNGNSITSSSGKLNVVLWANFGGAGGFIELGANAPITTNGGNLWLGGGTGSTAWNGLTVGNGFAVGTTAMPHGIYLQNGAISTGGGNIAMFGMSAVSGAFATPPDGQNNASGIYSSLTNPYSIDSGAGTIFLDAVGQNQNGGFLGDALYLNGGTMTSSAPAGTPAITLIGDASAVNAGVGTRGAGVSIIGWPGSPNAISATGGGDLVITGIGSAQQTSMFNAGIRISDGGGTNSLSTSNGGNIILSGNALDATAGNSAVRLETPGDSINSSGNLAINGAGMPIDLIGQVSVAGSTSMSDPGQNITAINPANAFSGPVSVLAANNVALSNAVAMILGSISAQGTINAATLSGNLNLTGNIATTDTSANAIILSAALGTPAGTATGGDITVSGSPAISTGSGGRASLYTGSIAGSSGLTNVVPAGNFRYGSDQSVTNFTAPLGSGVYAIYREQPVLTVTPNNIIGIYGTPVSLAAETYTISGYVNGDNAILAGIAGTAGYLTTATNTSLIGSYGINFTGSLTNALGYAMTAGSGIYDILPGTSSVVSNVISVVSAQSGTGGNTSITLSSGNGTGGITGSATITMLQNGTLMIDNAGNGSGNATQAAPNNQSGGLPGGGSALPAEAPVPPASAPVPAAAPAPASAPAPGAGVKSVRSGSTVAKSNNTNSPSMTQSQPQPAVETTVAAPPVADTAQPAVAGTSIAQGSTAVAQTSLMSGLSSVNSNAAALDTIKTALTEAAVSKGLPVQLAAQASSSFNSVLVQSMAKGMPLNEAVSMAQNAFNAVVSLPVSTSPASTLSSAAPGSADNLSALSKAATQSGSQAFEKALSTGLSKGGSPEQAVHSAQNAAKLADEAAAADSSPLGGLAKGEMAGGALANSSPDFQKSLGSSLANGVPLEQAVKQAAIAAEFAEAAQRAESNNPVWAVSTGNAKFLHALPADAEFEKSLGVALSHGLSMEEAVKSARESFALRQQGIEMDAKNPLAGFSNGQPSLPQSSRDFDEALGHMIALGIPPGLAVGKAGHLLAALPAPVYTPATALASGNGNGGLLNSIGHSRTFDRVLGNALARGLPVEQAMEVAKRADAAAKPDQSKNNANMGDR